MKTLIILILLMVTTISYGQAPYDRAYYKLPSSSFLAPFLGMRPMNFGLTKDQIKEIYDLTNGKVDFSDIYVDFSIRSLAFGPNPYITSFGSSLFEPPSTLEEYDPITEKGWWQQALNTREAWEFATGKGVTTAVCDAGYYIEEADINSNLLLDLKADISDKQNPEEISDGPFAYHGTAVVSILAGVLNKEGINGIAYNSKVIPLQHYNYTKDDDLDKEEATASCILKALTFDHVDIILIENQTNGSSETFEGTREAVKLALMSGVTVVSTAGNSSNELIVEEKNDTGSIIVGAVNKDGTQAKYSNYGSRVSISAYGENILTLHGPNGDLGIFGKTSAAAPQVAGAIAMMIELEPNLTPQKIKEIIVETRFTSPTNQQVGGVLNIFKTVQRTKELRDLGLIDTSEDKDEMRVFHKKLIDIL